MGENSKIEWTDHTFSPWVGCTKVSAACDHCYAESWAKRTGSPGLWAGDRRRTSPTLWKGPLKWQANAAEFQREHGRRQRVFCASLADVFDNQVPTLWREDLWTLIQRCPDLDFLLLTKRPQNIAKMLPSGWPPRKGWPNVWLGMTGENQEEFDRRYEALSRIPARLHFISYEPALGPLTISGFSKPPDWVIAGGESGPQARAPNPEWFRSLRDECALLGVPYLLKQWGEYAPTDPLGMIDGMSRVGKKTAGRLLDGIEHNGFPAAG